VGVVLFFGGVVGCVCGWVCGFLFVCVVDVCECCVVGGSLFKNSRGRDIYYSCPRGRRIFILK